MYIAPTEAPNFDTAEPASAPAFNHACHPHFTTFVYGGKALDDFMALHKLVTDNTEFVLPRTRQSIEQHIASGHYAIAVYSEAPEFRGQMIAQALIALPDIEGASNLDGYPIANAEKTAIVQSFGVHPKHANCGITALFSAIKAIAEGEGRTEILAKVHADNKPALNMFGYEKNPDAGFKPMGDPAYVGKQDYKSVFMRKALGEPAKPAEPDMPKIVKRHVATSLPRRLVRN